MSRKSWQISRRTMLKGTGVAIALPLLEAMLPVKAFASTPSSPTPPLRTAFMYFPNGVWQKAWIPEKDGADYVLPYSLEPLAPFQSSLNVFSGLDKATSRQGDGHYAKTANFLTGLPVTKTTGKDISAGGISLDQLIAGKVGHLTPLPSLELGIDPVISGIDTNVGFTRLYGSYISWRTPTAPVAREINPRFAYERLFGSSTPSAKGKGKQRAKDMQSLLDLALEDANHLRARLGRDDQIKIDEYLEGVRAVEKRIEFAMNPDPREWKPEALGNTPQAPAQELPRDYAEHVKLMLDLMVLAFQTDSTRVQTFMFANDVSGRNFSFLPGVSGGHHDMSHHESKEEKIKQYQEITRWHTAQFAYFLEKLRAIPEGEGTLLDNSMLMFGSSFSDGNSHNPNNLPIVVAGNAGGALKTGMHIASPKDTPLCNLYVTMLDALGHEHEAFGDSNGRLDQILTA